MKEEKLGNRYKIKGGNKIKGDFESRYRNTEWSCRTEILVLDDGNI